MKYAYFLGFAALAIAAGADAKPKKPNHEDDNMSCFCMCKSSQGGVQEKWVQGHGKWKGDRAQCQALKNSHCIVDKGGKKSMGKLHRCDTVVHSVPPGRDKLRDVATPATKFKFLRK